VRQKKNISNTEALSMSVPLCLKIKINIYYIPRGPGLHFLFSKAFLIKCPCVSVCVCGWILILLCQKRSKLLQISIKKLYLGNLFGKTLI